MVNGNRRHSPITPYFQVLLNLLNVLSRLRKFRLIELRSWLKQEWRVLVQQISKPDHLGYIALRDRFRETPGVLEQAQARTQEPRVESLDIFGLDGDLGRRLQTVRETRSNLRFMLARVDEDGGVGEVGVA